MHMSAEKVQALHFPGRKNMVTSIARQSVIIKCNMNKSVLTGNYEFYYAAGLAAKLTAVGISEEIRPQELSDLLKEELPKHTPADEREKYLFELLSDYRPGEEYDGQMKELLLWGKGEQYLWTVVIPSE